MTGNPFVRKNGRLTKEKAKGLVNSGLQRAVKNHGLSEVALAGGCSDRCIQKALAYETLPGVETLTNILDIEPSVLDELLAEKGLRLSSVTADPANDLSTAAGLSHAAGALIEAHQDGRRCHTETLEIADKLRPLLPQISAIVEEADRLRSAA